MLIWGFNVSIIKILVAHFPPVTITSLRIFTAGVTVFIILGLTKQLRIPYKNEGVYIFFGALLSVVSHHYFLAAGLVSTTAVNAGLILGMGPLLTAVFSMILLKRKPTWIRLAGFILGGLGVTLTILAGGKGFTSMNSGDLDILLSILSQAMSFIIIRKASETMDTRLLTGYMLMIGSILLFILSLWAEPGGIHTLTDGTPLVWLAFAISAVFATAVGHMVYNYAIGQIGAAEASIFMNLSTFFSLAGAALFLSEPLFPAHFFGLILIVSGVVLGSGSLEELFLKKKNKFFYYHDK